MAAEVADNDTDHHAADRRHEPGVRSLVTGWLRARGHSRSPRQGPPERPWIRWPRTRPAIAMCDVGLPDRDGIVARKDRCGASFRRRLSSSRPDSGVTALPSKLEADAIGYLPKPFTEQQLMRTVNWALRVAPRQNAGYRSARMA